jgi:hypothetical protein
MPQPYFVPVNPNTSRRIQRSGVSGEASTSRFVPLTVICIEASDCELAPDTAFKNQASQS